MHGVMLMQHIMSLAICMQSHNYVHIVHFCSCLVLAKFAQGPECTTTVLHNIEYMYIDLIACKCAKGFV